MNYDQSAAGNYTDDPTIESGGIMVTEDSKTAILSSFLTRNISSSEFRALKRKSGAKRTSVQRTVLVVAFVSLVIGAIAYTAFAFASPETSSPVDASTVPSNSALDYPQGLPKEFIEEVLASVFRHEEDHPAPASNSTHRLRKRATPVDQHCNDPTHWLMRVCLPNVSPRRWEDRCIDQDTDADYDIQQDCPENTICVARRDNDGDEYIDCDPSTPPRQDNQVKKRQKVTQYGYRILKSVVSLANTQQTRSIDIQVNMNDASASGVIMDEHRSFVIAPNNELNAHARGYKPTLCKSGAAEKPNGRICDPLITYDFRVGRMIDFSFGLSTNQKAVLFYHFYGDIVV